MVVLPPLLVARRQPPKLLEPINQPLHPIPQPVDHPVKRAGAPLVELPGDGVADAPPPQVRPDLPAAVAFVPHHALGAQPRPSTSRSLDRTLRHQLFKHRGLVLFPRREHDGQGLAMALDPQMDFGAEAALAPPQRLGWWVPLFGTCRVLVRANDGGVDMMHVPIQFSSSIGVGLDCIIDALPNALFDPAVVPRRDRGALPVARRQVLPGRTRPQNPQDAIDDRAIGIAWAATFAALRRAGGWEQGLEARPLYVS